MTGSDRVLWGVVVAVAGGAVGMLVTTGIDVIRRGELAGNDRETRIHALELEHQPHRRHMGGAGLAPRDDHPGRNVENPTAPEGAQ